MATVFLVTTPKSTELFYHALKLLGEPEISEDGTSLFIKEEIKWDSLDPDIAFIYQSCATASHENPKDNPELMGINGETGDIFLFPQNDRTEHLSLNMEVSYFFGGQISDGIINPQSFTRKNRIKECSYELIFNEEVVFTDYKVFNLSQHNLTSPTE
jgi:hypothetical protein